MAFTVNRTNTVLGNERVAHLQITADAATQAVETGLKRIISWSMGPSSMNSSNIHVAVNSNASGVQSFGVLGISGCTSGDLMFITVFGV